MQAFETSLHVRGVKTPRTRSWLQQNKGFSEVEQWADIAEHDAPVHIEGGTDIGAASACSNHRCVAPHSDSILAKVFDGVRFGRAFIYPRSEAHAIPDFAVFSACRPS